MGAVELAGSPARGGRCRRRFGWGAGVLLAAVVVAGLLPAAAGARTSSLAAPIPGGRRVGHGAESAAIYWDSLGIPHIYARTRAGMWFAAGWAQAKDRLFQLELTRAALEGDLSALFGSSQVSTDESQRLFFYTSTEYARQFQALPTATKQALRNYSQGINAYEAMAYASTGAEKRFVPEELWLLGAFYGLKGPFRPAPWRPVDTVAIAVYLARSFGQGGGNELQNLAFLQYLQAYFAKQGDPNADADAMAVFNDSRWINDPSAPTTVPASCPEGPVLTQASQSQPNLCSSSGPAGKGRGATAAEPPGPSDRLPSSPRLAGEELAATAQLRAIPNSAVLSAEETLAADRKLLLDRGPAMKVLSHGGSNAFAVAPWRSADHHALLWGAPQEGFSTPSVNFEESLHGPHYDAAGMAIAGEPFVLIGHNANIAWTTTSEETIDQGVFVEHVRFSGSPPEPVQYFFDGRWVPVQVVHESIPVLGAAPVPYTVYRTIDGPIFSTDLSARLAFSMDFTSWMKEYGTLEGFSELGGDGNLAQFRRSMRKIVTLHNFLYADRQGNIAFFSDGLVPASPSPLSPGADPRLPHLGDGSQQWSSFVPFSQMPHSINPGQGYLVNWNTKPSSELFYQQNGGEEYWGTTYHSEDINRMLSSRTGITVQYLASVEHSIGTIDNNNTRDTAIYFIPYLERAYQQLVASNDPLVSESAHPLLAQAMTVLERWYGRLASGNPPTIGSPAMSIYVQFIQALDQNVFSAGHAPGEQYVGSLNFNDASLGMGTYGGPDGMAPWNMLLHILAGTSGLVPCHTLCYGGHYFGGHRDQILVESLNDAISILSGTGPQLGRTQTVPGFGTTDIARWGWQPSRNINWDSLDPVASAGNVTVNCGTSPAQNRSSYFIDMDMAPVPFGYELLPPGESGFINDAGVAAAHFCDQVRLFDQFRYAPFSSSVSGVQPAAGAAGSAVAVKGHGLSGALRVYFGSVPAPRFTVVSPTKIRAVVPRGSGTVDVRVTTPADPAGTASNPFDRFTYS